MKILWKIYKYFAITVVTILLIDMAVVVFVSFYRPEIKKADAIVILGAAINTPALYNRSLEGLRLYEQDKADLLVLSGGRINEKFISEAEYMQKAMLSKATKPLNIILEMDSHTTYENLMNTKNKIGAGKSLVIVSDQYHLARAVILAKRLGFGEIYWSAPNPSYYSKKELSMYYFREMIAMIAYIPKFVLG